MLPQKKTPESVGSILPSAAFKNRPSDQVASAFEDRGGDYNSTLSQVKGWKQDTQKKLQASSDLKAYFKNFESQWAELSLLLGLSDRRFDFDFNSVDGLNVLAEPSKASTDKVKDATPVSFASAFPKAVEYFSESTSRELNKEELEGLRADNFFNHMKNVTPMHKDQFEGLLGFYEGFIRFDDPSKNALHVSLNVQEQNKSTYLIDFVSIDSDEKPSSRSSMTIRKEPVLVNSVNRIQSYNEGSMESLIIHYRGGGSNLMHLFVNKNNHSTINGIVYHKVAVDYIEPIGTILLTEKN